MENYIEFVSVPAIAAVVFAVMDVIKYAVNNSKFNRYIPLLSALLGAACGIICYYALPDIIPAHNVVAALVIGGASGLTATGTHQLVYASRRKQRWQHKGQLKSTRGRLNRVLLLA